MSDSCLTHNYSLCHMKPGITQKFKNEHFAQILANLQLQQSIAIISSVAPTTLPTVLLQIYTK